MLRSNHADSAAEYKTFFIFDRACLFFVIIDMSYVITDKIIRVLSQKIELTIDL